MTLKKEPPWGISIYKADNGYILTHLQQLDDGTVRRNFIAVEEPEDGNEAECARDMLWEILEFFSIYKGISIELKEES